MPDYIFINQRGHELAADGVARRGQTFETETQARAHAEHLATILAGDLEVCDDHFNAISEPWPGVDELPEVDGTEGLGKSSY